MPLAEDKLKARLSDGKPIGFETTRHSTGRGKIVKIEGKFKKADGTGGSKGGVWIHVQPKGEDRVIKIRPNHISS